MARIEEALGPKEIQSVGPGEGQIWPATTIGGAGGTGARVDPAGDARRRGDSHRKGWRWPQEATGGAGGVGARVDQVGDARRRGGDHGKGWQCWI